MPGRSLFEPFALLLGAGGLGTLAFALVMARNVLRTVDREARLGALRLTGTTFVLGASAIFLAYFLLEA